MKFVHVWWDWCSESLGHTFAGVTAPLLLLSGLFVVIFYATGSSDEPLPQPPRSDVAGICVTATPGPQGLTVCGTAGATGALAASPTPIPPTATPAPKTYTVKSGDTLLRICANQVPSMGPDGCVDSIIQLTGLSGPDEMIYEGQQLTLPPNSGTPTATTHYTAAPTSTPVVEPTATQEPATETESAPTPSASLVAIETATPADEATAAPEDTTPTDEAIANSQGKEYTVESGDSLSSICASEVADMTVDDCVAFVVLLNNMDGPDQIAAGDTILIP